MSNIIPIDVQYDFFKSKEECEIEALKLEVKKTKEMSDKVRKAFFAFKGEQLKFNFEQDERLKIIERGICQNQNF